MTYFGFHAVFILPFIGVLAYLVLAGPRRAWPRPFLGLALLVGVAVVYTTPWDNYLVARGVWGYDPSGVVQEWTLGVVPLEEYVFFVLQPIMTWLSVLYFGAHQLAAETYGSVPRVRTWRARVVGMGVALGMAALGVFALLVDMRGLYFGLILTWAAPVIGFHWFYGGDYLWTQRRWLGRAILLPTIYLWVVDRIALEWGIWHISPEYSTGWHLLGLPVEEAFFFLVTNFFVAQGLLLYFDYLEKRRALGVRQA